MLWFLRGLRRGVVTTRYPAAIDSWAAALPGPPAFDGSRLDRELAARLAASCATGALGVRDGALELDIGRCTGCGRCVEIAPGVATPAGTFELAARARSGLVKRIPIGGDAER